MRISEVATNCDLPSPVRRFSGRRIRFWVSATVRKMSHSFPFFLDPLEELRVGRSCSRDSRAAFEVAFRNLRVTIVHILLRQREPSLLLEGARKPEVVWSFWTSSSKRLLQSGQYLTETMPIFGIVRHVGKSSLMLFWGSMRMKRWLSCLQILPEEETWTVLSK